MATVIKISTIAVPRFNKIILAFSKNLPSQLNIDLKKFIIIFSSFNY